MSSNNMDSKLIIQVAAGVVVSPTGEILLAKRPDHKHQGGRWEFPGGKIEAGESSQQALERELWEEVGINVRHSEPLIRIHHDYPDKRVCLDVLKVTDFTGTATGLEGQEIAWVPPEDLLERHFPAANTPIIAAARLPRSIMITGPFGTENELMQALEQGLSASPGMVQFRAPWLSERDYLRLARRVHAFCRNKHVPLIANCTLDAFHAIGCEGVHLTSAALHATSARPLSAKQWVSAACHTPEDLREAEAIGVDFVLLSPVAATLSHPDRPPLGWETFSSLTEQAKCPVYALGGMAASDIPTAVAQGGQGIAAIGAFWH